MRVRLATFSFSVSSVILPAITLAQDWPQWRGPTRDGQLAAAAGWPSDLDGLQSVWRVPLGPSYSGPIVAGPRVFVTETRNSAQEVVTALDRRTGQKLWSTDWPGSIVVPFYAAANGSWIRSTPASDGDRLFVAGIRDVLVCLNAETGQELWRVDFAKQFQTPVPDFGTVCSPLIDGNDLYLQASAAVVKLDATTGKVLWRSQETTKRAGIDAESSPFSSPIIGQLAGTRQLVMLTRARLAGIALDTGRKLWSVEVPASRGMNIVTPLLINDSVFVSAHSVGSFLFDVTARADQFQVSRRWQTPQEAYMSSPVLVDGFIYLHLRNQRFTCMNPETGKTTWTTQPFGKYWSVVVNESKMLALDQTGQLRLIQADPATYRELDSHRVSDAETWAHLAVSGRQVFVRELGALAAYEWPQD